LRFDEVEAVLLRFAADFVRSNSKSIWYINYTITTRSECSKAALYELSHQLLQLLDLWEPARAVKLNWTLANAGTVYNTIPATAMAVGDMRADDPNDFKAVETAIREPIRIMDLAAGKTGIGAPATR
jgi:hypothetical protein